MSPTLTRICDDYELTFSRRDLDQVHADVGSAKHLKQYKATKADEDLPGLGRYYCIECAKWFESDYNLLGHKKGKNHKRRWDGLVLPVFLFFCYAILTVRRLRFLQEEPHTQEAADAAVGLRKDNGKRTTNAMDIETNQG